MKKGLAVGLFVSGAVAVAYYLSCSESPSAQLSDGSVLRIQTVSYGGTNVLIQGTFLERLYARLGGPLLGRRFPALKVPSPKTNQFSHLSGPQLALQFVLKRPAKDNVLFGLDRMNQGRVVFFAEEGVEYYSYLGPFSKHGNRYYGLTATTAFSRKKTFGVRIEVMEGGDRFQNLPGTWREVARFRIRNPAQRALSDWTPEVPPITKSAGNLEVTLNEILLDRPPTNFALTRPDLVATCAIQTKVAGQVSTNWRAYDVVLREATGNFLAHSVPLLMTNGWRKYAAWGALDPELIWKLEVQMARDSGFDSNELFRVRVPYPLNAPIKTNLSAEPVEITFVNTDMLAVSLASKPKGKRLTFVQATDPKGNRLDESSGSWSQHSFWRSIRVAQAGGIIEATVAIHTNRPVEFFVQPNSTMKSAGVK